tara:strand:- start:214 stop:810 length:597 start_codon:yes stop_codon:yes gene_type:complete
MTSFIQENNICSDRCWREAKDIRNTHIDNYYHYNNNFVDCKHKQVRMPQFHLDHINLRGRPGYGFTEECTVNTDSDLRNDPSRMTRDRCNIQLNHRLFQGVPHLRPGGDFSKELDIKGGSDSDQLLPNYYGCKKGIHEQATYHPTPLLDCVAQVVNVDNTVAQDWNKKGGQDTRSFINRKNFLEKCDGYSRKQGTWVA